MRYLALVLVNISFPTHKAWLTISCRNAGVLIQLYLKLTHTVSRAGKLYLLERQPIRKPKPSPNMGNDDGDFANIAGAGGYHSLYANAA